MKKYLRKSYSGMTLVELSAAIVVMAIIALGMTSGAQAVMLHYQSDTVRQDIRQYGNNIMREITRELNLAQKVEIGSQNGFATINLYEFFTDISPSIAISCNQNSGIKFNNSVPLNGVLNFPNRGVFRGENQRTVYVDDFLANYEMQGSPSLSLFKNSYIHLTLTLAMETDVMDEFSQPVKELHTYHRTVFLGTAYIQSKITNAMGADNA
jgi:prepilin-type N-terminal cleavage/methylation domain-containing protein